MIDNSSTNPTQLQKPTKSSHNGAKVVIIIIGILVTLFILAVVGFFALVVIINVYSDNNKIYPAPSDTGMGEIANTTTDTIQYTDDLLFADGKALPPISKSYLEQIRQKTRTLQPSSGYISLVNGIGKPSYTFSFLYKADWKTIERTTTNLTVGDKTVSVGLMMLTKSAKDLTCKELVQDMMDQESQRSGRTIDIAFINNSQVTINGETWDRVEYTMKVDGSAGAHAVDQCLKRPDTMFDFFLITSDSNWRQNKDTYMKILNDIIISPTPVNW